MRQNNMKLPNNMSLMFVNIATRMIPAVYPGSFPCDVNSFQSFLNCSCHDHRCKKIIHVCKVYQCTDPASLDVQPNSCLDFMSISPSQSLNETRNTMAEPKPELRSSTQAQSSLAAGMGAEVSYVIR